MEGERLHRRMHACHRQGDLVGTVENGCAALAAGGLDEPRVRCVHAHVGVAAMHLERLNDAAQHLGVAAAPQHRGLTDLDGTFLCVALLIVDLKQGRYDRADEPIEHLLVHGTPSRQAFAYRMLANIAFRRDGDLARASQLLEQSIIVDPPPETGVWWHDGIYRASFLFDAGRFAEAAAFGVPALRQQWEIAFEGGWASDGELADLGVSATVIGRIHAAIGDVDAAARCLDDAADYLQRARRRPYACVRLWLGQAELAIARHDPTAALERLDDAGTTAHALGIVPTILEIDHTRTIALAALGQYDAASDVLEAAMKVSARGGHLSDQLRFERLREELAL